MTEEMTIQEFYKKYNKEIAVMEDLEKAYQDGFSAGVETTWNSLRYAMEKTKEEFGRYPTIEEILCIIEYNILRGCIKLPK